MITANTAQVTDPQDELFKLYDMEDELEFRLAQATRASQDVGKLVAQLEALRARITEVEQHEHIG